MIKIKTSFKTLDVILLALVLFFTGLVLRVIKYNLVDKSIIGNDINGFAAIFCFILHLLQFKALRKTNIFIVWVIVSSISLWMYFDLYDNSTFIYPDKSGVNHNYANGLKAPFCVLIFFQICRQISLKKYNSELAKVFFRDSSTYSNEEKRDYRWIDHVYFFGFLLILFLAFYF